MLSARTSDRTQAVQHIIVYGVFLAVLLVTFAQAVSRWPPLLPSVYLGFTINATFQCHDL